MKNTPRICYFYRTFIAPFFCLCHLLSTFLVILEYCFVIKGLCDFHRNIFFLCPLKFTNNATVSRKFLQHVFLQLKKKLGLKCPRHLPKSRQPIRHVSTANSLCGQGLWDHFFYCEKTKRYNKFLISTTFSVNIWDRKSVV